MDLFFSIILKWIVRWRHLSWIKDGPFCLYKNILRLFKRQLAFISEMYKKVSCDSIGISVERTNIGTVLYRSNTIPLYKKDWYRDRYWSGTIPFRYRSNVPSSKNCRSLQCRGQLSAVVNPSKNCLEVGIY